jgi:hypothetical protein
MSVNCFVRSGRKGLRDNHLRLMVLGVILLMFPVLGNIAQAQQLSWVKQAGGTNQDIQTGFAVDGSGNIYLTGSFQDTATFGEGGNQKTLISRGLDDIFVAKYNTAGELVWAKQAGGAYSDYGFVIAIDGNGNSYVTGWLGGGGVTFGAGEANETILTGRSTATDIFVAKYGPNGELLWARQAGSPSFIFVSLISVDGSGNSYVMSFFNDTVTFAAGETNEKTLTSRGSSDIFVAKYDTYGVLVWAIQIGGTDHEQSGWIAVDDGGNSYVTGMFNGTATFGEGGNQKTLESRGLDDIFVAKYDTAGGLVWAKQAGGTGYEASWGIAVDGSGNSYVTGMFNGTATFGEGGNQKTLISRGLLDIFVAKYNTAGGLVWAKQAGGANDELGGWISVDGSGNSYVSGAFYGTATFGEGISQVTLTSAVKDNFVAKYNTNGGLVWAKQVDVNYNYGLVIAADGSGNIYMTGPFLGTVTFGAGEANETILTSRGLHDIFVAKYRDILVGDTPAGPNVLVIPQDSTGASITSVEVDFSNVTGAGTTAASISSSGPPPPTGFSLGDPATYFDIQTTAGYSGSIKVCINYAGISFSDESNLRLFHQTGGVWEDVTTSLDIVRHIICGTSSSLSPFAILKATYQFVGFFPPVQTGPAEVNLVKAGSAIPLKWQLRAEGRGFVSTLFAVKNTSYKQIGCSESTLLNDLVLVNSSGSSGLRYDFSSNQYIYTWRTAKSMKGKCYRFDVEFTNGEKKSAYFQMW